MKLVCECGTRLQVPESARGKRCQCPTCERMLTAPTIPSAPQQHPGPVVKIICACGEPLEAPESTRGQTCRCPFCSAVLPVPERGPANWRRPDPETAMRRLHSRDVKRRRELFTWK